MDAENVPIVSMCHSARSVFTALQHSAVLAMIDLEQVIYTHGAQANSAFIPSG